jgi:prepilin-type N-terminal cleavage/methylation domain-containing protein
MKKEAAFTILEVMIVISLLALIAAFAVPNYTATIAKAHERDMIAQLSSLHSANSIYAAQNDGVYWTTAATTSIPTINNTLNINLIPSDGTTFSYVGTATTFTGAASWGGFTVSVTQGPISATNPACTAGACP